MMKIRQSLPQFIEALKADQSVEGNINGEWSVPGGFKRITRKMFCIKSEDRSTAIAFKRFLEDVEKEKIYVNASAKLMNDQVAFYQNVVDASRLVVDKAKGLKNSKELCQSIELATIKLQYRVGLYSKEEANSDLVERVQLRVKEWMKKEEKFENVQSLDFSAKIREMCQYSHVINYLLKSEHQKLANEHFSLYLNDNYFTQGIEYPAETEILSKNFLARRSGAFSRSPVSVDTVKLSDGSSVKRFHMLMEGRKIDLLDKKQKINFSNGLVKRLDQIYSDFARKKNRPGDFEMLYDGVLAINGHYMGAKIPKKKNFWNRIKLLNKLFGKSKTFAKIDQNDPKWFEKLPVLDYRSKEYIKARYGIDLEPGQWTAVLDGTRYKKLDLDHSHGYATIFQPLENGQYRLYTFGVFPEKFPKNDWELINFVGATVKAIIAYPDPNFYYSYRQLASKAWAIGEAVALSLLKEIRDRKEEGLIFQLGWENCAYAMREIFIHAFEQMKTGIKVPDYYRKKLVKTKPSSVLQLINKAIKKLPTPELRRFFKLFLAAFFRATRYMKVEINGKIIKKSLWRSPFFQGEHMRINLPSALHERVVKERRRLAEDPHYKQKFPGVVLNYGHGALAIPDKSN